MVPKGWLKTNFGAVTEIANGQVDPKVEPYLSMLHIGPENVVSNSGQIIDVVTCKESSLISGKYKFDENAIVYSKIRPNLNKVCRPRFKGVCSADMYPIWAKGELDIEFLLHYMLGPQFYKVAVAMSMRTGMPKINRNDLNAVTLLLPPVCEQKKIAQILSTWDKAITTTERLIDLAHQQKKALMQQLLTGKKRLAGFEGEWANSSLKKLVTISKGQQLNRDTLDESGLFPVINGGITPSGYTDQGNYKANTITISEGGNSCGYVAFQKNEFWCGGHCYALTDLKLLVTYMYQLLKFNENRIMRLRVGSGLPNIQKKDLEALVVTFPVDSNEQKEIAKFLTTADQEIETLQSQLDGLKQEKKALMQALLTGKRRVQVAEV